MVWGLGFKVFGLGFRVTPCEVIQDLNDEGRVKVNFPKGCWRFKPSQMASRQASLKVGFRVSDVAFVLEQVVFNLFLGFVNPIKL